jgi:hypothetical protein
MRVMPWLAYICAGHINFCKKGLQEHTEITRDARQLNPPQQAPE